MTLTLRKTRLIAAGLLTALIMPCAAGAERDDAISQKQKVVAGAVYKFIKFIEWPALLVDNKPNLMVCLQQYDPAFEPLQQRNVHGKIISLLVLQEPPHPEQCDVLYLNGNNEAQSRQILAKIKTHPVLTIGAYKDFIAQGGIIGLGEKNNRLKFEINRSAAKLRDLSIGFQLLALADQVIDG